MKFSLIVSGLVALVAAVWGGRHAATEIMGAEYESALVGVIAVVVALILAMLIDSARKKEESK